MMSHRVTRSIVTMAALALIAGCAGRTADPIAVRQHGDNELSCHDIEGEMMSIDRKVRELVPEVDSKTPTNVALGVTGAIFIVPLFFMDFSGAEQAEINAYKERYEALATLEHRKGCHKATPAETT